VTPEEDAEVTKIIVERIRIGSIDSKKTSDYSLWVEGYAEDMAEQIIVGLRLGSWLP
jgi:hypothetical protein